MEVGLLIIHVLVTSILSVVIIFYVMDTWEHLSYWSLSCIPNVLVDVMIVFGCAGLIQFTWTYKPAADECYAKNYTELYSPTEKRFVCVDISALRRR